MDYQRILAETYDAVYAAHRAESGDIAFYRDLALAAGGPVVELGCGTGRIFVPILDAGADAVGVDPSVEMLRVLRDKRPGATVFQQSMETLDLPRRDFALAIVPFRAFQHLMTVDAQREALSRIRAHLRPGGRLALDVFDPKLERMAVAHEPETDDLWFEHDGRRILRRFEVRRDRAAQTMEVVFRYYDDVMSPLGESPIGLRWIYRYELEHLLAREGFVAERWYSGYDRRPYDASGEIVVVAARA